MLFLMKNRLSKILAACGVASRRESEKLILNGEVRLNSQICRIPQTIVELGIDRIEVKGKPLKHVESKVVYILNKPKGYVCSNNKFQSEKVIFDLFPPDENRRLFTVGRLDKDTTGLILVTNDGQLAQKLIHPASNISKEYLVKTTTPIRNTQLKSIQKGQFFDNHFIRPLKVVQVNHYTLKITIKEGKKHEIRHFVQNVGLKIDQLKRIRIGSLYLRNLPLGIPQRMTEKDLSKLGLSDSFV